MIVTIKRKLKLNSVILGVEGGTTWYTWYEDYAYQRKGSWQNLTFIPGLFFFNKKLLKIY